MNSKNNNFTSGLENIILEKNEKPALIILNNNPLHEAIITYNELGQLIDRYLSFYQNQLSLEPNDNIIAILPNSVEMFISFLAAMKGGYGFAPLSCSATQVEIEKWVNIIKPKYCLKSSLLPNTQIQTNINSLNITCDQSFSFLPKNLSRTISTAETAKLYLSTSGTTGEPKALVLDINRLWASGVAFSEVHRLEEKNLRFWNFLPMSYLGGLFNLGLIPLCTGSSILIDTTFNGKTFLEFWQIVDRYDITALWLVPAIIHGLLKFSGKIQNKSTITKKVKFAFLGTAPISLEKKLEFENTFNISLLENYGLSETTFISTELLNEPKNSGVGKILPYIEIKLHSHIDNESTEIFVKTPFMFLGYLTKNGMLETPIDQFGFLATGDIGTIDSENRLLITGRNRDIIKKAGVFIALREIEVLIEQHALVHEAIAGPIQHDFYGESYLLYVIPKPNISTYTSEQIRDAINAFLHENLIQYKWPEDIKIVAELPRTMSGKVRKHILQKMDYANEPISVAN